ncbi:MAG: histidine kinase [Gammaproteobacteria bacterium]|jgi:two-component system sensor histidine kinase AlgZ
MQGTSRANDTVAIVRESRAAAPASQPETLFLPSFCDIRVVLAVVIIAELFAFVLVLAANPGDPWSQLGLVSLFLQLIALSSAALLCLVRPWLARMGNTAAAIGAYLLLLVITAVISELAFQSGGLGGIGDGGTQHGGFLSRNIGISAILSALVLRYLYVQHQWRQQIQAEAQVRVQALQARIRPHFLFNSMNSIAALTRSDPVRAEQAVQDLSDLFRVSLQEAAERVTLDEEIRIAERYLRMEALRLGNRLRVEWDIERLPRKRWVPSLILQPLLENAVYHGIEPSPDGGLIRICGWAEGRRITIRITNPRAPRGAEAHRKGNQIALDNIRLRLQLAFGSPAGVALTETDDSFETTLYFPREKLQ